MSEPALGAKAAWAENKQLCYRTKQYLKSGSTNIAPSISSVKFGVSKAPASSEDDSESVRRKQKIAKHQRSADDCVTSNAKAVDDCVTKQHEQSTKTNSSRRRQSTVHLLNVAWPKKHNARRRSGNSANRENADKTSPCLFLPGSCPQPHITSEGCRVSVASESLKGLRFIGIALLETHAENHAFFEMKPTRFQIVI